MKALACGLLLMLSGCSGCDGSPATPPKRSSPLPGDVLLAVDGIEFTFGEVQPFLDFYDRLFPEWGKQTKMRQILTSHLVPLKFARRDFPEERQAKLAEARALCTVADNARELETRSASFNRLRQTVQVQQVDLPTAMFLFDSAKVGSVSPPLEVAQGWTVATALDLKESNSHVGGAVGDDLCDALMVGFFVADKTTWESWLQRLRAGLAQKKATFVHPDYRDAIPEYLLR